MDDYSVCEKYAEDTPFMESRCNCPPPSFCIGRNLFAKYFLAMHFADGDLRLF